MTIYRPELVYGDRIAMKVSHPKHMVSMKQGYEISGQALLDLGEKTGAEAVLRSGSFEDTMLRALDMVSAQQQEPGNLMQQAILDPGSVDAHDISIAQAKANMSLNITRTVLSRIVQGWKDIINTR